MAASLALLLLLLALPAEERPLEADTVWLTSGKSLVGRVVYEDETVVVVKKGSREQLVPAGEVKEIDSRTRSLGLLLDRLDAFGAGGPPDGAALMELARFAEHARLPGEARLLWLWTLLADPTDAAALEALGGRQRQGHASLKHGSSWIRTADLGRAPESWGDRWTLETAHYEIQTNLPLQQAIRTALDAERYYRAFYALFARELQLREPDEVLPLDAHADAESYPEPVDGRRGYFDEGDRTVDLLARDDFRTDLFHELTHQILFFTTQRTAQSKGQVPAWLVEGLAEALARGAGGHLGRSTFDPSAKVASHFEVHARASRPFDLNRVLAFQRDDYYGTSDRALKYAQSYTLLYFVLYGEEGRLQKPFFDFFRSAYEGRSSATDFKKILGIDAGHFEKAWSQYVAEMAS